MLLCTLTTGVLFAILPLLGAALPVSTPSTDAAVAKAHNIYLVTCAPHAGRNDDPPTNTANFTAIAYFRQPLNATGSDPDTKAPKPDQDALVSQPPEAWEGVKWRVKVWRDKLFSANIAAGANTLAKGGIAGSVSLADEQYACFRDGETAIRIRDDPVKGNCVADYWCGSLGDSDS